ncbi:unnamed protein product [Cuscuta campestris]|uniref:Heat stress transcription factor n=1 Tax=Cuscuta campestris TaxID=132261 RepID=A0A484KRE8_9ASTE|nr:unnamed protein product [Cuscuta campestris]
MDGVALMAAVGGGGAGTGNGGPAPFLLKTYEMLDDSNTDHIVQWTPSGHSFVVWNPPEFSRLLLPTYFKHNNFSSFIRQLNTYGFRKIDPERWEFANDEFLRGQKHLLKNIHRRKPIHSHSHPPGSAIDPERAAFVEQIDKLTLEKSTLEASILTFRQQHSTAKLQVEQLTRRVANMEQRQEQLLGYFKKHINNPKFVECLAKKLESMDFSAYTKKRRLPLVEEHSSPVDETILGDNHSSSRPEFGNQNFSDKLRLELSPAVSDVIFLSHSTQSSNEDGSSSPHRVVSEGWPIDLQIRTAHALCAPETVELSDTGTSFTLKMDSTSTSKANGVACPRLNSFQNSLTSNEEVDDQICCHLNLTLASSSLQVDCNTQSARLPPTSNMIGCSESRSGIHGNPKDHNIQPKSKNLSIDDDSNKSSAYDPASGKKQGSAAPPARVNDVFWERFLTERPGSSDNEEASSSCSRVIPSDEQEDSKSNQGMAKNTSNMDKLTL